MAEDFNKSGLREDQKILIQKALDVFRVFHKNDDGFIEKRDILRLRDELPLTGEQLQEVFTILDSDNKDYLTEEELIQGFASYLGIDPTKLNKEQEQEIKKKTEQKENEEYEDLLNTTGDLSIHEKMEVENLWRIQKTRNPRLTVSEFELLIKDLGKGLRREIGGQEAKKDFFSLHTYYYKHINAVMHHLESGKPSIVSLVSGETLSPVKENKCLNSLLQDKDTEEDAITFDDDHFGKIYGENSTPPRKQEVLTSPPIKSRKRFLKSPEESSSSVSQRERQHSLSKLVHHASDHVDYEYCHPPNNYILPAVDCPERLFKVIFVGDSGVGKTSFIHRFCYDQYLATYHATVGVDFRVKTFAVDGHLVAFQLWDTAGQERYRSISKQYFRKTDGVIFMYDITSELSFRNVRNWIAHTKENSESILVSALVGNKKDVSCAEQPLVPTENGEELAEKHRSLFYETSCKTGEGVWNVMSELARALQANQDREIERVYELHKLRESKKKCC